MWSIMGHLARIASSEYGKRNLSLSVPPAIRYSLLSQPEHEQHGLVAHLPDLRRLRQLGPGRPARARQDRDVLLAVDLEAHRRRAEAGADVDLPELLKRGVVVGREGAIEQPG